MLIFMEIHSEHFDFWSNDPHRIADDVHVKKFLLQSFLQFSNGCRYQIPKQISLINERLDLQVNVIE